MRRRYDLISLALLALTPAAATAQQHLEPERGSLNDTEGDLDYAKLLAKTLLKDAAFHYRARVICLPYGKPAWVITLVREGNDEPTYFLEYASFEGGQDGQPIEKASVRHVRTPIDPEAAEAIQDIWLRMLGEVRHPRKPRLGADGTDYHFSRFVPLPTDDPLAPPGWESGRIWTPDPSSATGRLSAIAEGLRRHVNAPAQERAKARGEILRDVEALRAQLQSP